jgi:hypothetical protein
MPGPLSATLIAPSRSTSTTTSVPGAVMRARAGLASTLLKLGDIDGAVGHYRDMLKLNPNDNQGIRYVLAGCLLRQGDDAALKLLVAHEDESAFWLYTRALVAFRENGDSDGRSAALVGNAWSANEHVPAILAGTKPPTISDTCQSRRVARALFHAQKEPVYRYLFNHGLENDPELKALGPTHTVEHPFFFAW